MEVYRRITERVRGALWAHHRRLMPERQFHRILAYVYNNKYEHQIRFDQMEVVGSVWNGRVEVITTPAGFLKKVRVHPDVADMSNARQQRVILAAYADACAQGKTLMEQAELNIYKQFLKDLKPIIMGIRDNPEFYTVPESSMETAEGTLRGGSAGGVKLGCDAQGQRLHRTIPAARADEPVHAIQRRHAWEKRWLESPRADSGRARCGVRNTYHDMARSTDHVVLLEPSQRRCCRWTLRRRTHRWTRIVCSVRTGWRTWITSMSRRHCGRARRLLIGKRSCVECRSVGWPGIALSTTTQTHSEPASNWL